MANDLVPADQAEPLALPPIPQHLVSRLNKGYLGALYRLPLLYKTLMDMALGRREVVDQETGKIKAVRVEPDLAALKLALHLLDPRLGAQAAGLKAAAVKKAAGLEGISTRDLAKLGRLLDKMEAGDVSLEEPSPAGFVEVIEGGLRIAVPKDPGQEEGERGQAGDGE